MLRFRKTSSYAYTPTRATAHAAGYDLYSAEDSIVLSCGERRCISTDLQIEVPNDCYGRIAPRSGLAFYFGIDVLAGVIDKDYTGVVKVILINHGTSSYTIHRGDRIAQLICEVIKCPALEEIFESSTTSSAVSSLSNSSESSAEEWVNSGIDGGIGSGIRGTNGFGSTGL